MDFVGIRWNEKIYVQVTCRMESEVAVEREFAPLFAINDHYPKFVVCIDEIWQENIEGVRHRHIADFLTDGSW